MVFYRAKVSYIEKEKKKILSQFEDIENEAEMAAGKWLTQRGIQIDPTLEDDECFYEFKASTTIGYFHQLTVMMHQTRLSVVAGMVFEWEKQLRTWLANEYKRLSYEEKEVKAVYIKNIEEIGKLLERHSWPVHDTTYFKKITACHEVVNAYKHGNGRSFINLKKLYPEYLHDPWKGGDFSPAVGINYFDNQILYVTDHHIQEFSDAIIEFWKNAPVNVIDSKLNR
ncbi:MAG: hypothetical protein NTY70_12155 [Burkholderiales bacterium]|nr:hypothetical protein [Burkholderiales bacterium]